MRILKRIKEILCWVAAISLVGLLIYIVSTEPEPVSAYQQGILDREKAYIYATESAKLKAYRDAGVDLSACKCGCSAKTSNK